jgi:hypothetical protein
VRTTRGAHFCVRWPEGDEYGGSRHQRSQEYGFLKWIDLILKKPDLKISRSVRNRLLKRLDEAESRPSTEEETMVPLLQEKSPKATDRASKEAKVAFKKPDLAFKEARSRWGEWLTLTLLNKHRRRLEGERREFNVF